MSLPGVDLSVWNGPPGAWTALAGNISWAGVKLTQLDPGGQGSVNLDAAADLAWLRDHGRGRVMYLYGRPAAPAAATAAMFTSACRDHGIEDGDGIAVDLETTDGLHPPAVAEWAQAVTGLLRRDLGRVPLLYTFLAFAWSGNCAGLGLLPLWIADPSSPPGQPRVPAPWQTWAVHQHGQTGIDRDLAVYASLADMRSALGRPPVPLPKTPLEDRMFRVLSGANADDGIALPDDAKKIRLGAVGETTVNLEFHGHAVIADVKLGWAEGSKEFTRPADSWLVRVYRPAAGNPDVPVTLAVS